ncbi:PD-(D/E)XK nuclease family protein [Jatrophihabitans telluris]|uniref:PD-(D/E)XK nuclease family protein n=1 Tax=Jatrophihabitans telluris TaxID=2038343 RepID=A0ABY4R1N4_9ACTN|nr:PD-(D/E)XK nuclease family protein [Jatrophihabitans telluris]UQX89708.1 PD-(D/E)XK nuclease family protein [Jatrophihabitans telluris]
MSAPEQLEFSGLPRPLFAATPSKLTTFDCPRRYKFTYVDRPAAARGPAWAHNTVGAAVHVALARFYQLRPEDRTPRNGARLVHRNWQEDGFADPEQSDAWRLQAARWVGRYLQEEEHRSPPSIDPRGVERTVATRTDVLAVSGRVDRIDERDGELVIVDYKTGRSRLGPDDARGSLALALYALAAERTLHQRCRRVELHHLPTGTIAGFEHTDESLRRQIDRAEQTATDIVASLDTVAGGADPDDVFEPAPGPRCGWCDFRRICPEGSAASVGQPPWAGLGELESSGPAAATESSPS